MKTSELKKWLDQNGHDYSDENDYIEVHDLLRIAKFKSEIYMIDSSIDNDYFEKLLIKSLEYNATPISEREEEKKYYLCSIINYSKNFDNHYIKFDCSKKEYYFFENYYGYGYATESKFTDKQISEMPIEIQKAIECGFLKKVEVENA